MALCAPEQAGRSPDAKLTIGGGGGFLSISRRLGNCTNAADIDGRPPKPTEIYPPRAGRGARGVSRVSPAREGRQRPLGRTSDADPSGDAATERGHERGGGPRGGARVTCRMEDSRSNYEHLRAQWGYRAPRSASSKVPHGQMVYGR